MPRSPLITRSGLSFGASGKIANHAEDRNALSFGGGASLGILWYIFSDDAICSVHAFPALPLWGLNVSFLALLDILKHHQCLG